MNTTLVGVLVQCGRDGVGYIDTPDMLYGLRLAEIQDLPADALYPALNNRRVRFELVAGKPKSVRLIGGKK